MSTHISVVCKLLYTPASEHTFKTQALCPAVNLIRSTRYWKKEKFKIAANSNCYWEIMLLIPNKSWSILFGTGIKTTMKKGSFDFIVKTIVTNHLTAEVTDQFWIQRSLKADFK